MFPHHLRLFSLFMQKTKPQITLQNKSNEMKSCRNMLLNESLQVLWEKMSLKKPLPLQPDNSKVHFQLSKAK